MVQVLSLLTTALMVCLLSQTGIAQPLSPRLEPAAVPLLTPQSLPEPQSEPVASTGSLKAMKKPAFYKTLKMANQLNHNLNQALKQDPTKPNLTLGDVLVVALIAVAVIIILSLLVPTLQILLGYAILVALVVLAIIALKYLGVF